MEQLNVASVLSAGPNFLERICALPTWIQEVVMQGLRHGAAFALAAAHLHLDIDLGAVEPGFLSELPVQRAS